MNYPLISEYIESIRYAEDNFATLTNLRPVLVNDGNPIMSNGGFAVVFKMQDIKTQQYYALKCFIKDQPERAESYRLIADELEYVSSEYLVHVRYLEKELFVNTTLSSDTEFPALLMDWVEGVTLDKWIKRNLGSQYSLQLITHQFCRMASWLISQPFAHGDLKPDNIIVRDDGSLVLVDYDGMYVPAMQGKKSRESGSPDYRHPARTEEYFNEHIDDFSLAAIAMQLCAIALDPALFANQNGDTLLLTERDHRNPAGSTSHQRLHSLLGDTDFERLYALYHLARAQQSLSNISFRAFQFPKPEKKPEPIELSTKVTDEDKKNGVKDEFGALYSPDGLRLLKGPDREHYHVRQGTRVICDSAFFGCGSLSSIAIPDSVTHIGANPFRESGVCRIESKSHFFEADDHALYTKGKRVLITFFDKSTSFFTIPDSVTHIGDSAFESCHSLSSINIPDSVTHIGDSAFSDCHSLSSISIPDSVTHIRDRTFWFCRSLSSINIPNSVTHIGDSAFFGCESLSSINIPDSVTHIGHSAFCGCESLSSINIPHSVTHIGANAFSYSSVCRIECDSHFFEADDYALYTQGKRILITFFGKSTPKFSIPDSVTHIESCAFSGCRSLSSINIPYSVTHIGTNAFWSCSSLSSINIPRGSRAKFERMLPEGLHNKLKEQ